MGSLSHSRGVTPALHGALARSSPYTVKARLCVACSRRCTTSMEMTARYDDGLVSLRAVLGFRLAARVGEKAVSPFPLGDDEEDEVCEHGVSFCEDCDDCAERLDEEDYDDGPEEGEEF